MALRGSVSSWLRVGQGLVSDGSETEVWIFGIYPKFGAGTVIPRGRPSVHHTGAGGSANVRPGILLLHGSYSPGLGKEEEPLLDSTACWVGPGHNLVSAGRGPGRRDLG